MEWIRDSVDIMPTGWMVQIADQISSVIVYIVWMLQVPAHWFSFVCGSAQLALAVEQHSSSGVKSPGELSKTGSTVLFV